jgi:hypothetical protein
MSDEDILYDTLGMQLAKAARKEAEAMIEPLRKEAEQVLIAQMNFLLAEYVNFIALQKDMDPVPYTGIATEKGSPLDEFRNELFLRQIHARMKDAKHG